MATVAYSGVEGTVLSGAVNADVTGFTFDAEAVMIDTTSTADAGWEHAIAGPKKVSGSFDFHYNRGKKPFASGGLNLVPGTSVTLSLALSTGETATGTALISKTSIKSATKEAIKGTSTFQSVGAWTLPS